MATKVYLLTSGEYSSSGIHAVFPTEKDAAEFARLIGLVGHNIEEWELGIEKERICWEACLREDGTLSAWRYAGQFTDRQSQFDLCSCYGPPAPPNTFRENMLMCKVVAPTPDHATKIATEKRWQLITESKWLKEEITVQKDGGLCHVIPV